MKTMTKLIAAAGVVAAGAGAVAIVRAARKDKPQVLTEDDLITDPVTVAIEEVFVLTEEDPGEPSTFTL